MAPLKNLTTAQIGKCGELMVQFDLLLSGVESAPLTTDSGIDLVAYSSTNKLPITIQVKSNLKAKPGGGKGQLALDWWIPEECPAKLVCLVDLATKSVWAFSMHEIRNISQQNSNGRFHLYMYQEPIEKKSDKHIIYCHQFENFLLKNRIYELFFSNQIKSENNYISDPIEKNPEFLKIIKTAEEKAEYLLESEKIKKEIGYCHYFWNEKRRILKNEFGVSWLTPPELNPDVCFD